ncbi:hypothetical protein CspHIS471_0306090 [Cutaneotrichosporon sp. HIS471]|nr:hypothetical protein CspHIS471_0306090 [Cutaneotrichosporon sp. HIS471]
MPDSEGKRKRRRRAKGKGPAPARPPPSVVAEQVVQAQPQQSGSQPKQPKQQPKQPKQPKQTKQTKQPKQTIQLKPRPKRFNPVHSARAREYVAQAAKTDRHALHIAASSECDPAEIQACIACQRSANAHAGLIGIKLRVMARNGVGTRVAALKKLRGSGATPPVSGGGSHSAVAWRRARRRPRPSALGPNRENDPERKKRREEEDRRRKVEERWRERVREKVAEARKEARGRGEIVRRTLVKLGYIQDTEQTNGGRNTSDDMEDEVEHGAASDTRRDAGPDDAGPARQPVLDIDNLPEPEIDPALAAMDAAGALDLLPAKSAHVASMVRVSGALDDEDDPEQTGEGDHSAHEPTSDDEDDDEGDEEGDEEGDDEGDDEDAPEQNPSPDEPEANPADGPETLEAAVARDYDTVAAARARVRAKAAKMTSTVSDRVRLGWEKRRRDTRAAENVAAYMELKELAGAQLKSILKTSVRKTRSRKTAGGPSKPARKVTFAPVVRVYSFNEDVDLDYPHPSLCSAIEGYARAFYMEMGAMQPARKQKPKEMVPGMVSKRRRESMWDRERRRELEEAGVWDEARAQEKQKEKGKGKEKDDGKVKRKREVNGPYISRDMTDAFDAILMEEYMAYQLRQVGWKKGEERHEGDIVKVPANVPTNVLVDPNASPAPQRMFYADVDGEERVAKAQAAQAAKTRRKVRFASSKNSKAKKPMREIPTIVLSDSSDEEHEEKSDEDMDDPMEVDSDDSD